MLGADAVEGDLFDGPRAELFGGLAESCSRMRARVIVGRRPRPAD